MSSFPSGVAVLTTTDEHGSPYGLTCTSLCSVSADPPTLLTCIREPSRTLSTIQEQGVFAVNLLNADGTQLARLFASGEPGNRFTRVSWKRTFQHGLPHLKDPVHAFAECEVVDTVPVCDHVIVLAQVTGIEISDGAPLLHGFRRYEPWPTDSADASEEDPTSEPSSEALTYAGYLKLPSLLSLQEPRSSHPDELFFVTVHQSIELWFRLILHDLRRVITKLDADRWSEACLLMKRINRATSSTIAQMTTLRELPPQSFHAFRGYLANASGLQSTQFREIEVLSGLRDEDYLAMQRGLSGGRLPAPVTRTLQERSLAEAHSASATRNGIEDWARFYAEDGQTSAFYLLSELLLDYDELWLRWRNEHISLVESIIGASVRGTGGTDPTRFLERTRSFRFFPYLWSLRSDLGTRNGGTPVYGKVGNEE